MTKQKTIREWLEELPDGYRERALRNYDPEFCDTGIPIIDLADAVMWGFYWEDSPEKHEFWLAVWWWALGRSEGDLPQLPKETGSGWREMIDALIETDKDLRILKNQLISAAKSNHRFEGMDSVVEGWIQRGRDALRKAGVDLEEVG